MLFYQHGKISTQVHEQGNSRILWVQETPAAQLESTQSVSFLKSDHNNSVLGIPVSWKGYTPYGYLNLEQSTALLAFNGERLDPATEAYAMGNGYRLYNPALQRFYSPDNLSPFSEGGVNCYAYCEGDPINNTDSTGHVKTPSFIKTIKNIGGRKTRKVERIKRYNEDITNYNTAINKHSTRPNLKQNGNVHFKNLLENSEAYESRAQPVLPSLSNKDSAYAEKHKITITPKSIDDHRAETLKMASKYERMLDKLSFRLHEEAMSVRHTPQNPINTKRTMWDTHNANGKWQYNS
ncbi:hypothetical protein PPUJ20028_29820 [Pseudomonas putida]|uniref:RHS repeat-associated core domain-containing protein n=1 Tax=Pseudomonas putida TaxID=303 RepID=A0AA37RGN5_PSEPU|nr:RHS repeat-associated core domain-containing protein [Pseudomonas putida]GLO14399.1 hypothetical protein PPUJ20028_29820 [Pseudomonas putida]GLO36883.1 hypothetical protein PPUN14671_37190 [Pseudomonas putida]